MLILNFQHLLYQAKPEERLSADDIMNHPWLDDPAVRKKAETLMREQASQSHQPIRSNYQPNPPIRGTNLQMTTGQQPMRGQQQPLKPSNQINGPGVTLTLMKRPVPMDVDPGLSLLFISFSLFISSLSFECLTFSHSISNAFHYSRNRFCLDIFTT